MINKIIAKIALHMPLTPEQNEFLQNLLRRDNKNASDISTNNR